MNWKLGLINSEHVLKNAKIQEFIKDDKIKFDLVIVDQSYHESMYLFAHKFNCPLVTIGEIFSYEICRN
jgi:glucuronosyltransferase